MPSRLYKWAFLSKLCLISTLQASILLLINPENRLTQSGRAHVIESEILNHTDQRVWEPPGKERVCDSAGFGEKQTLPHLSHGLR